MIKSHHDLAKAIEGKSVLHLNSLGKDSAVCLEWLTQFAKPSRIVSVYFKFLAENPWDKIYQKYQKKRYPGVEFIERGNGHELNNIVEIFQSPVDQLMEFSQWEHYGFELHLEADDIAKELGLDFICVGHSRYESMARAKKFHDDGILIENRIYPIGMMGKADIVNIIKETGLKLHPSYKLAQSTIDYPSYYKMRSHFLAMPEYYETVKGIYPLIVLDKYRYEKLFKGKKRK